MQTFSKSQALLILKGVLQINISAASLYEQSPIKKAFALIGISEEMQGYTFTKLQYGFATVRLKEVYKSKESLFLFFVPGSPLFISSNSKMQGQTPLTSLAEICLIAGIADKDEMQFRKEATRLNLLFPELHPKKFLTLLNL